MEGVTIMQFSFDHLVWFTKQPEKMILPLKQRGIHAVNGGRHETWGTYNSLAYFGLSYIEFLGIENISIAKKHQDNRLVTHIAEQLPKENGEGPARIAVRTDQIEQLAVKLKEEGFPVFGPLSGERVRTDGQIIRWSLLFPENEANKHSLPFFIQWEKSDGERLLDLRNQGLIGTHFGGNPKLESVGIVVNNLDQTVTTWGQLLNLKPSEEFMDPTINARCRKLELLGTKLLFCAPNGAGPAQNILKEKGETPFLVNLTETQQNTFFELQNGYWKFQ
jgi:hypothetical protein